MLNKRKIIYILGGIILLMAISLFILKAPSEKTSSLPVIMASPTTKPNTPYISYNETKRDQLINIMKARPKITDLDQSLRVSIISKLGDKSGVITQTPDYIIKYVKAANIFQVQILTSNFLEAKQQATSWFEDQGFSKDGLCKLPIQFYLSAEVKDNLQDKIDNFNYLPEGC